VQPDATGASVITDQGYSDQLFQIEQAGSKLKMVKMGCPGENTTTMINGGLCPYELGSQLAQAVDFLANHANHIAFVTLAIGANDVNNSNCITIDPTTGLPVPVFPCILAGLAAIAHNLPLIVGALKAADPNVVMVGTNYYDPFLAVWLKGDSTPAGLNLAGAAQVDAFTSLQLTHGLNLILGTIYAGGSCTVIPGFPVNCVPGTGPVLPVADVASAFSTDCFSTVLGSPCRVTPFPHLAPPVNVAPLDVVRICQWTWMCVPAPVGPNIHLNQAGYAVMAQAFLAKL
jgi:lysophospholipase L1-like esterase